MPFTGKATFTAGASLPEIAEDVSDIIGIVSPYETPLLDHLGDPRRAATSTIHEWLEDSLIPNTDLIDDDSISSPTSAGIFKVANADRFRPGDQLRMEGASEVMLVLAITAPSIIVQRNYGGTPSASLTDGATIVNLGNAAIEGDDRPPTRFTNRTRNSNYTQIFSASVEVSGSQRAAQTIGIADELDYQKQERLRELIRDLENCVINGVAPTANPQGSASVRRTMNGIIPSIQTNIFLPGVGPIPDGDGAGNELNEDILNAAMRTIWQHSSATIDTILVGGTQKRRINRFIGDSRGYAPKDTTFSDLVAVYESDFGVARIVLSRWVPSHTVLLLDSSRLSVLPLSGRSFHYKPLASSGDSDVGQIIGEYTLEMRNENAHGLIRNLAAD